SLLGEGPGERFLGFVRYENLAEHRAGEVGGEGFHVHLVVEPPSEDARFVPPPELPEPRFLICPDAGEIEGIDAEHDAMQAEGGEGVIEHQARRLRAVTLAARIRRANHDAELRRAI